MMKKWLHISHRIWIVAWILILFGLAITLTSWNLSYAWAEEQKVDTMPEDEEKNPQDATDSDLVDTGKDVIEGIGGIFSGSGSGGDVPPGARLVFQVIDWAGRPVDGTITVTHRDGEPTYTQPTTASRATIIVENPGTYSITLAPARGRSAPPRDIDVPSTGTLRITLRVLPHDETTERPPVPDREFSSSSRDLSSGRQLSVQGRVQDEEGRPTDAFIRVFRGDVEIGHIHTTASRFSRFDLEPGEYRITAVSPRPGAIEVSRYYTQSNGVSQLALTVRHTTVTPSPTGVARPADEVVEVLRKPDLTAKSLELAKTGICKTGASLFEFRVKVTNSGTADAPPTGSTPMLRVYNAANIGWATEVPLDPLEQGTFQNLVVPVRYASRYRGLVSSSDFLGFTVKVDHRNLVDELNEGNNARTIRVRVPEQCKPAVDVPAGVDAIDDETLPERGIKKKEIKKIPVTPVPIR